MCACGCVCVFGFHVAACAWLCVGARVRPFSASGDGGGYASQRDPCCLEDSPRRRAFFRQSLLLVPHSVGERFANPI